MKREKLEKVLFEQNRNVFSVSSTNISASYTWSYSLDSIIVFELYNDKVIDEKKYSKIFDLDAGIQVLEKSFFELDHCYELDGDFLRIKVENEKQIIAEEFPINLNCFKNSDFETKLFDRLSKDLKRYDIGYDY